jgi:hypothetical protein
VRPQRWARRSLAAFVLGGSSPNCWPRGCDKGFRNPPFPGGEELLEGLCLTVSCFG